MISAVVRIHYYTFTDNHLLTFSNEESSCKEKIIMNDEAFVCNTCVALTTNLLVD